MSNSKFVHEEAYRGKDLITKLQKFQLTVCGAGALGSNLVDTLCRQGASQIRVIDFDRVDSHNVNTQVFGDVDVGALKVEALKNRMFDVVGVEIETHGKRLTEKTAKKFLRKSDLVLDTFDNSASRQLVRDYCRGSDTPCLHAGMHENYGEVVWDQDYTMPYDVVDGDVCDYPLARNLAVIVAAITAEEVLDFCLAKTPRSKSWSLTLKDLTIRPYR